MGGAVDHTCLTRESSEERGLNRDLVRPGFGSSTDDREAIPGEVHGGELVLFRDQQQCLPLPDVDTSILATQRALGYPTQTRLYRQDLGK